MCQVSSLQDVCNRRRWAFLPPIHEQPRKGQSWIGLRTATLLKRDSHAVVFLWILRNFYEHLFWRTSPNGYFWIECENAVENPCQWLKKDLAAQEVAFKFLKTFINILWNFRFIQYCYCLDLLKVCEIFSIQSCICNITAQKNITCQK